MAYPVEVVDIVPNTALELGIKTEIKNQTDTIADAKGLKPIRFCHWVPPQWGSSGFNAQNAWYVVMLTAIEALNMKYYSDITKMQIDLAKDYQKLAEEKWDRFADNYKPFEEELLFEAASLPEYTADYTLAKSHGDNFSASAYRVVDNHITKISQVLNINIDGSIVDDISISQALSQVDTINYRFRDEESYVILRDDIKWNRRSDILNLGRGIESHALSYAQAANQILGGLSTMARQGMGGALSMLGYLSTRNEPMYGPMSAMQAPSAIKTPGMDMLYSGPGNQMSPFQ